MHAPRTPGFVALQPHARSRVHNTIRAAVANGHPRSTNRAISRMSASDEVQALADTLDQSSDMLDLSDDFLDQGVLAERVVSITGRVVQSRVIQQWLSGQGYTRVLSNRQHGGRALTVWTRYPEQYVGNDGEVSVPRVLARADEVAGAL